jgi:NADPH:quinone reductase-like Zn-dependent oxidoreductase
MTATTTIEHTATIPATMRATAIGRFGGVDELKLQTLPVPTLADNEVLIQLHTVGVGVWETEMRAGWWPDGVPTFPLILGTDGSGTIAALGSRIRRFELEQPVYAYSFANPKGGFYAEYVAVTADKVSRLPETLDLHCAGAVPTSGLTALQGIDTALRVKNGESVVVVGASGAVGSVAVQFAKLRGARVLAIASGPDGVELALRLGAETAVDGRKDDVTAAARAFAPKGIDAVLAFAGGPTLEHAIDALSPDGRVAYPNGVEPVPKPRDGIAIQAYNAVPGAREFERLNRAINECKLQVQIAASYPLADAAKAHERLAQGHVLGKVVLQVR